jgi:hypothetical protein
VTALEVGFLDSVAWRTEGALHVSMHLPGLAAAESVEVRFRDGDRRVRRPATVSAAAEGTRVEVAVPAQRLADGLWRIAVRAGDADTFTRVEARLLVRRGQPVALLPGAPPRTRMAEPAPRTPLPSAVETALRLAGRAVGAVRRGGRRL